jgi:glutathione S-transferase
MHLYNLRIILVEYLRIFDMSPWISLITVLTLLLYLVITINVGRARAKYKVSPPQMTGNPDFERVLRVQQNTLEQMVLFIPGLWLFSFYVSPLWGAVLGAIWLVGRVAYAWGYYQAAEKRAIGFAISSLSGMVLLLGSLIGIILSLIQS